MFFTELKSKQRQVLMSVLRENQKLDFNSVNHIPSCSVPVITDSKLDDRIFKGAVNFVLCNPRFSVHLKEDEKLGRFPFSELKSDHNCAQEKLPKARQRRERGGGERLHQSAAPGAADWPTLEACPGRNYDPISILKTGIFLTFRPLSNALKIGGCTEQSLRHH